MSDGSSDRNDGAPATQAPPIVVNAQYVKDLSFENPQPLTSLASSDAPRGEMQVNVSARPLGGTAFEVVLSIRSEATVENATAFILELDYAGVFTLNGVPDQHVHRVLMIEAPHLLFPFARQVIANVTREGGFMPMLLPPIDFAHLYLTQAQQQQDTAGTA